MRRITTLLSLCSLIVLFSCTTPSGNDVTQRFPLPGSYYSLYISDGMKVTVTDAVDEIVITADENVMEKIKVEYKNGRLRIFRKDVALAYVNTSEVLIPYDPALRIIEVSMDSEFSTDYGIEGEQVEIKLDQRSEFYGYILADEIEIKLSDYSKIDASFDANDNIYLKIFESSHAYLDGYTPTVRLEMNDNSTLEKQWNGDFYAFMCDYCYGTMNNNCEAYIDSESEIALDLTNNCYLYYTSNPYLSESTIDDTSDFIYGGY